MCFPEVTPHLKSFYYLFSVRLSPAVSQLPDGAIRVRPGQSVGQQPPHRHSLPSAPGARRRPRCLLCVQEVYRSPHALLQLVRRTATHQQREPQAPPRPRPELRARSMRGGALLPRSPPALQGRVVGRRTVHPPTEQELPGEPRRI